MGAFGDAMKSLADLLNDSVIWQVVDIMSALFIVGIGCGVIAIAVLFVIDSTQTKHAVRRNYPVIGRFRYLFESLGEYFRQYFFAMDREELPFNRAQRAWVIARQRASTRRSPLARRATCGPPARSLSPTAPSRRSTAMPPTPR